MQSVGNVMRNDKTGFLLLLGAENVYGIRWFLMSALLCMADAHGIGVDRDPFYGCD